MEKLLPRRDERGSTSIWIGFFGGLAISNAILNVVHLVQLDHAREELKQNERDIQVYHDQIADELSGDFDSIEQLALVSSDGTISFTSMTKSGDPEKCKGSYAVSHDKARITGSIVCSQTESIRVGQ